MFKIKQAKTYWARIYIATSRNYPHLAKEVAQQYCDEVGLCVNISKTEFIYSKGFGENGWCIELINYPRFPKENYVILNHAVELTERLIKELKQLSASIVTPNNTLFIYLKEKVFNDKDISE